MKKFILLLVMGFGVLMASAQRDRDYKYDSDYKYDRHYGEGRDCDDDDRIQTIFSGQRSNGGYGALSLSYTEIENKDALMVGARGSWIMDHSFAIGLGGYGFFNDLDHHRWLDDDYNDNLAGGYGGIYLEPIIGPSLPVHISFPVLVGVGGIARIANEDYWENRHLYDDENEDVFWILEPSVELELNVTRFMRLAGIVAYRFTSEIEMENTDPDVMEGFSVGLIMKFGKF